MPPQEPHPEPTPLDDLERTGATRFGSPVERVVMHLADGRRVSVDLPRGPPAADADRLTRTQRQILQVLRDSPAPLTRKAVAARLSRPTAQGRFGQEIRALLDAGHLYESGGELTDDPAKFPAPE